MDLEGEFVWGSNYTFLVKVELDSTSISGVYKPTRGERPLWDFPRASLAHREVAAFIVSEALGWGFVPPTVYRQDGPAGAGSLQMFIEHDPEYHYFNFSLQDRERLRKTVLFDYLINNADRKGSHMLIDPQGKLWLIDHGICFHEEDKLRTVIWEFCDSQIPDNLREDLNQFSLRLQTDEQLLNELKPHLTSSEFTALESRVIWLKNLSRFPNPPSYRRATPWPPV